MRSLRRRLIGTTALVVSSCAAISGSAQAQEYVWGGGGSTTTTSDYNTVTNWGTGIPNNPPPDTSLETATFHGTGNSTVQLSTAITLNALLFSNDPSVEAPVKIKSYTLTGGTITLAGTSATIQNNSVGVGTPITQTIMNAIAGSLATGTPQVVQNGSQTDTLVLGGINTYTGDTLVEGGALKLIGSGSVASSFVSVACTTCTFDISGVTTGSTSIGGLSTGLDTLHPHFVDVTLGANTLNIGGVRGQNGQSSISGVIAGTGGVNFTAGLTYVQNTQTYTGATSVRSGAALVLFNSQFLSSTYGVTASIASSSGVTVDAGGDLQLYHLLPGGLAFGSTSFSLASLSGAGHVYQDANTLVLTNASGTFSGIIGLDTVFSPASPAATGGLTIAGGKEILSGNNIYTGATTINPGAVLQLGSGGESGSVAGAIVDNGTLMLDRSDAFTLANAISGAGGLEQNGSGTATLSGTNSYAGGTTLAAGVLSVSQDANLGAASGGLTFTGGTLKTTASFTSARSVALNAGGGTFQPDAGTVLTLSGVLSGTGALTKTGAGALNLTGASTYTGPTTIAQGLLSVNGSIAGSTVTVGAGGTLGGNGTVGGLSLQSGATAAPGNSIGTLNVNGNIGFAAGSAYAVEVNAAGQGDKIVATGKATLSGGTVQVVGANGTYTPSTRYTILTAAGGVSGTFAQLTTSLNLAFLSPFLAYDANDVFLGFTLTTTPAGPGGAPAPIPFPSVALTRNQATTAAGVQALGLGNPVYNAVVGQTVAGARQAFDALSGEIHASAVSAAIEDSRFPREAILDRLSQHPLDASWLGVASTMTGAYSADLPSAKGPALAPVGVQMYRPRLYGLWGQGFGDFGHMGGDNNAAKLTRDMGGFIIGADAAEHALGGTFRLGVAGGYTDDSLKVANRQSSGDYQSVFGALYGGASFGAIDVKAGAVAATTRTHTSRAIIFPFFNDTASSSYDGSAVQAFSEIGYTLPFHVTPWSFVPGLQGLSVDYQPFLQGALIHLNQDRYVEGSLTPAGLVGASRSYDLGTTTLGWRTEYRLASLPGFTLRTMLGWRHAYGDVRPSVVQSFAGAFGTFTVAGVPIDRDALAAETTLDYAVSSMVTVGASYSSQTGRRTSDNAFKGHVDVSF